MSAARPRKISGLSTTLALVAATGTEALGFTAPSPCNVLIIDGEMASEELQSRMAVLQRSLNLLPTDRLRFLAADWQDDPLRRLDTRDGQAAVEPHIAAADFIVLDNRSTLFDPESEKDASAWQAAQDWLLSLRRRGKAVLIVHHSNRQGGARGHSKPEDVMNVILKLTRPEDYCADQGARFIAEFTKARGAWGAAVAPFTATLTAGSGWTVETEDAHSDPIAAKLKDYLRLAAGANESPRSATAAIRGARVKKINGLHAWGDLLRTGAIRANNAGGFVVVTDA